MVDRRIAVVIDDMLDAIDFVYAMTADLPFHEYVTNRERRAAIERHVEIVSEASRRLPDDLKTEHPEIAWRDVAGIGNFLRHRYHAVQDEVVYNVAVFDFPALREVLASMRSKLRD